MTDAQWQKQVDLLERLLAEKDKELAQRDQEIIFLKARVSELEKRLGLNSSNSSKPPSSDGLRKKPSPKSLRRKGKNPSGGQKGHKGSTLNQVESPDEIVRHQLNVCPDCNCDLEELPSENTVKRQVFDIPPMDLVVTEHQAEVKSCKNCKKLVTAAFPEDITAPAQYGDRIKAMAVYLNHQQLIPEDRVQDVFKDLFDLSISTATIVTMGKKFAAKVTTYVDDIREYLKKSPVKNLDESGFRIAGNTNWLHVMSNKSATVYRTTKRRGDIEKDLKGVICHDHFRSYFTIEGVTHSLCNAHILRELTALIEHDKEPWARKMRHVLNFVGRMSKDEVKIRRYKWRLLPIYDEVVEEGLKFHESQSPLPQQKRGKPKRRDGHNLLIRLRDHKDDVLRCINLKTPDVPFTNNQAEQDIRMMKVKQKISGGFRTMEGAQAFATIRSFTSTMRKQGYQLFEAITHVLKNQTIALPS
jgi:transposase